MSASVRVFVVLMSVLVLSGCDVLQDDEPRPPTSIMLLFRIEADTMPDGGWVYWYVHDRVLRYVEGEGYGPHGVDADCGSHAGIAALVDNPDPGPTTIDLVIETVVNEPDEPVVARKEFVGAGEHQLIVRVACP